MSLQERASSTVVEGLPAFSANGAEEGQYAFAPILTADAGLAIPAVPPYFRQPADLIEAAGLTASQDMPCSESQTLAQDSANEQVPVTVPVALAAPAPAPASVPDLPRRARFPNAGTQVPSNCPLITYPEPRSKYYQEPSFVIEVPAKERQKQKRKELAARAEARKRKKAAARRAEQQTQEFQDHEQSDAAVPPHVDPAMQTAERQSPVQTNAPPSPGGVEHPPFSIIESEPIERPLTPPPPRPLHDYRAAGIQSAAALFRQPTNKKYTRPPMASMYTSLELSPGNFLHLQAAAKHFMLDPAHPERRECVGQKGKLDNEMFKLRLHNCVREFLDSMGNGEKFFGEDVVDPEVENRTLFWPRDNERIITLLVPLLRRMVTNERQRRYAIESRKNGAERRKRGRSRQEPQQDQSVFSPTYQSYVTQQSPPDTTGPDPALIGLLYEGSPTDWASISLIYNTYNGDHQLDNLAVISGLQKSDWWGIVAVIESHFRFMHNCEPHQCSSQCQQYLIDRILDSASFPNVEWQGVELKRYIITSLVRDVLEVMSMTVLHGNGLHQGVTQLTTGDDQDEIPIITQLLVPEPRPVGNVVIQINLVTKQDNKRVGPPIFVNQPESYRLDALLANAQSQLTSSLQLDPHEPLDISTALTFPVKVWMPDGLLPVNDEEEWQIALMTLLDTEWVDKQIKILVDVPDAMERAFTQ